MPRPGVLRSVTAMSHGTQTQAGRIGLMLNKVPEVTVYFWLIKVLSTTVGETAADFLDTNLNGSVGWFADFRNLATIDFPMPTIVGMLWNDGERSLIG